MIVANMATFPSRKNILIESIERLLPQVDKINLCLNEYNKIPHELKKYIKLNPFIPKTDYKDVGKFVVEVNKDDYILLVDDDIVYPNNYVDTLLKEYEKYTHINAVVGVHGVIYSDIQNEQQNLRKVFNYTTELLRHRVVNQLGTGTILLKGHQMPALLYMNNSQQYVDVRFAKYLLESNIVLICIPREKDWMKELKVDESIWNGYTKKWPIHVTREVQKIAGYSKLNFQHVLSIEKYDKS